MIRVIDYGLGNVQAFITSYQRLGVCVERARTPRDLEDSAKIILPGVGAFDHAMDLLDESGMGAPLCQIAREGSIPILGICVGMQMLAGSSEEGVREGLGLIPGTVRSLPLQAGSLTLPRPHMGWNDVTPVNSCSLFDAVAAPRYYFLHSYFFDPADPADRAAVTTYGSEFASAVQRGTVYGVQFHPEKSHHWGSELLRNFARL